MLLPNTIQTLECIKLKISLLWDLRIVRTQQLAIIGRNEDADILTLDHYNYMYNTITTLCFQNYIYRDDLCIISDGSA
jgi:hypothetical protein